MDMSDSPRSHELRLIWRVEQRWDTLRRHKPMPPVSTAAGLLEMFNQDLLMYRVIDGEPRLAIAGKRVKPLLEPDGWNLRAQFNAVAAAAVCGEPARFESELDYRGDRMALRSIALPFGDARGVTDVAVAANWRLLVDAQGAALLTHVLAKRLAH